MNTQVSRLNKLRGKIQHSLQYYLAVGRNYRRIFASDQTASDQIPKRHLAPFLPPNPVIVEAGAFDGYDTMQFSRIWPRGRIHAFEPVPTLFARLRRRLFLFPNVQCYPLALGAMSGPMTMYVSGGSSTASSSLLPPKGHLTDFPTVTFDQQITVQSVTLDDWAAARQIDHVDAIWLDLQGYELQMLQAAPRILPTVRAIVSEISLNETYAGVATYPVLRDWLLSQGLREAEANLDVAGGNYGNALFVRDGL